MLAGIQLERARLSLDGGALTESYVAVVGTDALIAFLTEYKWQRGKKPLERDLEFLSGEHFDPKINDWLVLAPQLQTENPDRILPVNGRTLTVKYRQRDQTGGRYGVYSEPDHVAVANYVAGIERTGAANMVLDGLAVPHRGVMLLYPVQWTGMEDIITVGFALAYPPNDEPRTLIWGVPDPDAEVAPVTA